MTIEGKSIPIGAGLTITPTFGVNAQMTVRKGSHYVINYGSKFANIMLKIFKGKSGVSSATTREINYPNWKNYPSNGSLSGFRPGGVDRKNLKLR